MARLARNEEVRTSTMGSGAQSGQERLWHGGLMGKGKVERSGLRGQRTRHRMIRIRSEGYRRERESVICSVVSDSLEPYGQ